MLSNTPRSTYWINRKPAANLHHATRFASRINVPLNTMVTINFSQLGICSKEVSAVFQKIISQRFSPWLRRNPQTVTTIPPTYVWTLEAANKQDAVHWVLHVPPTMSGEFTTAIKSWVREIATENPCGQAVKIDPVKNIVGLKRYILKGTEPHYAKMIQIEPVDQGIVFGKRSGFSRNLGPMARKRNGYKSRQFYSRSS
jgi:hypothetical protein